MRDSAPPRGFRSLIVWQKAMDFGVAALDVCDVIPARAGREWCRSCGDRSSVPSNITEGYDRPAPEQLTFLRHARGSLWEAATQLELLGSKETPIRRALG